MSIYNRRWFFKLFSQLITICSTICKCRENTVGISGLPLRKQQGIFFQNNQNHIQKHIVERVTLLMKRILSRECLNLDGIQFHLRLSSYSWALTSLSRQDCIIVVLRLGFLVVIRPHMTRKGRCLARALLEWISGSTRSRKPALSKKWWYDDEIRGTTQEPNAR